MKTKKIKILCGVGISVIVLAIAGWLFFRLHLSWDSFANNLPAYTWDAESGTATVEVMGFLEMVFHADEPVVYINSVRVPMRDGIRIRGGRPYLNMRDAGVFDFMNVLDEANPTQVGLIINGLYGQGTPEQNTMIHDLMGGELARDRFEVYFQWYNTIHELGHLITVYHGTAESRHMVEEEMLVNAFTVAFWMEHGEAWRLDALEEAVDYALSNITPPVDNMSHLDFMRQVVDEGRMQEVFTFEIYGWFQFSMVQDLLRRRDTLDLTALLAEMVGGHVTPQPPRTLMYETLGTDMAPVIVADVMDVLRGWGVSFPGVYMAFSTDPNEHALMYPFTRTLLEAGIADGRVVPVVQR
ncbi:MAG: copper amine oxidase N-terminal domain-containing protein [Defluviitaleaceae bacterium]|nr:copper amine oxidase N-terminal domain-containing protein [Defluviitaleaceae bacterium]